jgi:hypothetical protein
MLEEWMNTPWAQEAHKASVKSLMTAAQQGEPVHPAFAAMAVQLDEIDRVLLDQLREQRHIAILDCCLSRMTRDKTFAGRKEAERGTEIPLISHMTLFMPRDGDYEQVQAALDNLQRLHLISIRMQTESKAPAEVANNLYEDIYLLFEQVIENTREQIVQKNSKCKERSIRLYPGEIVLTALGSRFLRVCKW